MLPQSQECYMLAQEVARVEFVDRNDPGTGPGLVTRPLHQNLADTLAWELTREPGLRPAGLSGEDERTLHGTLMPAI